MYGLIDGNNFYVSCERVFDPKLWGKPTVVLGNADGCAIAISPEAKQLGVKMGTPIFQVPTALRKQLQVRSANFALYGDLSGRIVSILRELFTRVEVYSIDENFVDVAGISDPVELSLEARERILRWVGIPCCVGLGASKTLAKAGNKIAKTHSKRAVNAGRLAVFQATPENIDQLPVEDVWGVGSRFAARLNAKGIRTAADLAAAPEQHIRSRYGVVLARTQMELRGTPCADLELEELDRKQIVVSRTFGRDVVEPQAIFVALTTFSTVACERMRGRKLAAGAMWVWLAGNPHKGDSFHASRAVPLPFPTQDTGEVIRSAHFLARSMMKPDQAYKLAGVGLTDLVRADMRQEDLFFGPDKKREKNMAVMDAINAKYGRGTLGVGAAGWKIGGVRASRGKPADQWRPTQKSRSPEYTTKWSDLLRVR